MEPRLNSRGNRSAYFLDRARYQGFNGAAAEQPRKLAGARTDSRARSRFNGAAAEQPRKCNLPAQFARVVRASMEPRLNSRGNARELMELVVGIGASMEPRLNSRGNSP